MASRKLTKYDRYLRSVEKLNGKAPENPFKVLRETNQITLESLAKQIGITRQAIIRTEQGTYVDIPSRIQEWFASKYPVDYGTLGEEYRDFQSLTRRRHFRLFGDLEGLFNLQSFNATDDERSVHPFSLLRQQWTDPITNKVYAGEMNVTECAKLLCIPQGTLDYFMNTISHQTAVPIVLINALREIGYSREDVDNFNEAYQQYRQVVLYPVGNSTKLKEVV